MFANVHECDIARSRMDVCFRGKSGRAADITAMTELTQNRSFGLFSPDRPDKVGRGTWNGNYEAGACTGHTRRKILRWYRKPASATASSSPTAWARKLPAPGVRWLSKNLPTSPPTSCVASGWKPTMPLMK